MAHIDNLKISGRKIESNDTNGNIEIEPNGTGEINLKKNTNVTGNITVTGTVDGRDIATDGSTLDSHTGASTAHGITGAVVGTSDAQTLSNKSFSDSIKIGAGAIDGSSVFDITSTTKGSRPFPGMTEAQRDAISSPAIGLCVYNTTTSKINQYDGSNWGEISGSGGVGGGLNLESDPYAQSGVGSWVTYDDGASASMVDGTGGSPDATFSVDAAETQILSGDYIGTFKLAFSAIDHQGEGVAKAYTIPQAFMDRGHVYVTFRYSVDDAAGMATGDFGLYAYDVTNATLLNVYGPTDNNLAGVAQNKVGLVTAKIYIANNTASLRLGIHRKVTTARAFNFYFSDIKISDSPLVDVEITSTPTAFTPVTAAGTGYTSDSAAGFWWRRGDRMFVEATWRVTATGGATDLSLAIPGGVTVNTDLISNAGANADSTVFGVGKMYDAGAGYRPLYVEYEQTTGSFSFNRYNTGVLVGTDLANGDKFAVYFNFPVAEWEGQSAVLSTTEMMSQTGQIRVYRSSTQTVSASTKTTVAFDSENFSNGTIFSFNSGTGEITVNKKCRALASAGWRFANHSSEINTMGIDVNGSSVAVKAKVVVNGDDYNLQDVLNLEKGDVVKSRVDSTADTSYDLVGASTTTYLSLTEIPDLSVYGIYGVHEYDEVELASAFTPTTSNTWENVTGMSLTLTTGTWQVGYDALGIVEWVSGTAAPRVGACIYNSTASARLDQTIKTVFGPATYTSSDGNSIHAMSASTEITVSTTTTIVLQARAVISANSSARIMADSVTAAFTDPDGSTVMWKRRIK